MPELPQERLVVVDHRPGHYLCFPDVCKTDDGRLIAVYGEFDRHAGTRRKLLSRISPDNGRTWELPRVLRAGKAHCPRINKLSDGQIMCVDDNAIVALWSLDNGANFDHTPCIGFSPHVIPSHVVELDTDTFLMTGHSHRGTQVASLIRQAPSEQMVFISYNRGNDWKPYSVLAYEKDLVLCEADMVRLPGGEILAVMRENSFVYEPMYAAISRDEGKSWSNLAPTCFIGHRPSIGVTSGGRLFMTYRSSGPDGGTCAWTGTPEELLGDFKVHGRTPSESNPVFTSEGMRIVNSAGTDVARFALRPMTNPARAAAEFEAEVRVDQSDPDGCAIHFGTWWRLYPDRIVPLSEGDEELEPVMVPTEGYLNLRFVWNKGVCTLYLNREPVYELELDPYSADTRPVLFGNKSVSENNACDSIWKRLKLWICEPDRDRDYVWSWHHSWGRPDQWIRDNVLELANDRHAAFGDYGYSGWTEIEPGSYFVVWHHGGGEEHSYIRGRSSRIMGAVVRDFDFEL